MVLEDPMSVAPPGQGLWDQKVYSVVLIPFRPSVTSETLSSWHHKSNNIAEPSKDVKRGRPFLKPWNKRVAVA